MATTKTSSSKGTSTTKRSDLTESASASGTQSAQQQAQAWTRMSEAELYDKALAYYPKKYQSKAWHCLAVAGIDPKPESSTLTGSECWTDYGDSHWWVDTSGVYMPAFTNHPYVSAIQGDDGKIRSSKEFGFGLVTACAHRLKEGDEITITISGTGAAGTSYNSATDTVLLPILAARAAAFTGGAAGDPTQTWSVQLDGAELPDYRFNPRTPTDYDAAESPLIARLIPGGIPFVEGDAVLVSIEGGELRWRQAPAGGTPGAWQAAPVFANTDLGNGLTLSAQAGLAPSFCAGDSWQFQAVATHGATRALTPRPGEGFAFDGDECTLSVYLEKPASVAAAGQPQGGHSPLGGQQVTDPQSGAGARVGASYLMIALHTLPETAQIGIAGQGFSLSVPAHAGPIIIPLPAGTTGAVGIHITGAGEGAMIGWAWAGEGWTPTVSASLFQLVRQYGLARADGLNPSALYRGAGTAARIEWQAGAGAALSRADLDDLLALLDAAARAGLEPLCLVPDISTPETAALAVLDQDDVQIDETLNFAQDGTRTLDTSVSLGFKAIME